MKLDSAVSGQYGVLMVEVNNDWTPVCDINFKQHVAVVACRQMKFKDGQFIPGMNY